MSAEFVRDNCDNVWFVYASKIQYRRCRNPNRINPGMDEDDEADAVA